MERRVGLLSLTRTLRRANRLGLVAIQDVAVVRRDLSCSQRDASFGPVQGRQVCHTYIRMPTHVTSQLRDGSFAYSERSTIAAGVLAAAPPTNHATATES